ncbi:hypothetical protein P885DRAFT_44119 [Corynascus similis CBS 632.67]
MTRENSLVIETQPLGRAHNLVSLPFDIRRRIYLHTGVARFDGKPYTYFLDGRRKPKRAIDPFNPYSFDPPPTRNFVGLLRCCRALYVEIAALLYSANRFAIFYSYQGSLEPLRLLAPTSLASLASLEVVLNRACHEASSYDLSQFPPSCCYGHADEYHNFWAANHHYTASRGGQHRRPLLHLALESDSTALSAEQAALEAIIGEWHDTVASISSYIDDGRLELSLEVTWCRQVNSYQVISALCTYWRHPCPPDNHNGCRLYLCDTIKAQHSGCCFCRVRHSAFSFACNCWAAPTDLFLICRTLYRDAQFVFFSCNRFIVHDHYGRCFSTLPEIQLEPATLETVSTTDTAKYYPFDRLAASIFLRNVVPIHCLSHLRFLELVFPPYVPHGWPCEDHPAIQDWIATIDWLRGQIHAPALTLRVVMADFGSYVTMANYPSFIVGRTSMTEAQIRGIWSGYRTIAKPLAPLAREDGLEGSSCRWPILRGGHPSFVNESRGQTSLHP